ncbi:hypothetical protein D3C71_1641770 [compost metagenome]
MSSFFLVNFSSSPASSLTITAICAAPIQALSRFNRWRSTSFFVVAMRPFNALSSAFHSARTLSNMVTAVNLSTEMTMPLPR